MNSTRKAQAAKIRQAAQELATMAVSYSENYPNSVSARKYAVKAETFARQTNEALTAPAKEIGVTCSTTAAGQTWFFLQFFADGNYVRTDSYTNEREANAVYRHCMRDGYVLREEVDTYFPITR